MHTLDVDLYDISAIWTGVNIMATATAAAPVLKSNICSGVLAGTCTEQPGIKQLIPFKAIIHNMPNPFSETTNIEYIISSQTNPADAVIVVYDMTGREIVRHQILSMKGSFTWKGTSMVPGVYISTMFINGKPVTTNRMMYNP